MQSLIAFRRRSVSAISFVPDDGGLTTDEREFLDRLAARAEEIGDSVQAVKGRVLGDNARGRQDFGESSLVHWR